MSAAREGHAGCIHAPVHLCGLLTLPMQLAVDQIPCAGTLAAKVSAYITVFAVPLAGEVSLYQP